MYPNYLSVCLGNATQLKWFKFGSSMFFAKNCVLQNTTSKRKVVSGTQSWVIKNGENGHILGMDCVGFKARCGCHNQLVYVPISQPGHACSPSPSQDIKDLSLIRCERGFVFETWFYVCLELGSGRGWPWSSDSPASTLEGWNHRHLPPHLVSVVLGSSPGLYEWQASFLTLSPSCDFSSKTTLVWSSRFSYGIFPRGQVYIASNIIPNNGGEKEITRLTKWSI